MSEELRLPRITIKQLLCAVFVVGLPMGALAYALIYDLRSPALGLSLIVMAVLYSLTELGVEAGFHRLATHQAFQAHVSVKTILIILGSMASQGPVLTWAANHRRHHRYADQDGDPHSPNVSLLHAHILWHFTVGQSNVAKFAPDLLMDPVLMFMQRTYLLWVTLGLALPAIAVGLITQSAEGFLSGLLWGGLGRICLTHNFTWSINSICHRFGSRPFDIPGNSRNNFWLAIPTMGQSWHNNHHAFPNAAVLNFKWWQVDPSAAVLGLLKYLGLVSFPAPPAKALAK